MKRRKLLQAIAAAPALAAVPRTALAQTTPSTAPPSTKLSVDAVSPDVVAQPVHRYFTADQYAALEHLGTLLVPKTGERPGAAEADAARFLDFLISQSPEDRQTLYKGGLDRLNTEAKKRFTKTFAQVDSLQAAEILKPLTAPWTYKGPEDPFARFLVSAKEDFLHATLNSRPFVTAMSTSVRGYGRSNYYWFPVE